MERNFKKKKNIPFCFINIMNRPFYVSILQNQLLPAARSMYRRNWHLQQDNDLKHMSHVAKDFIAKNSICTIDWPSNSPNLNPIENMWTIIKNNVEKWMSQNIDELTRFLLKEWEAIPQETVNNLVFSMKTWCELILAINGDRISY